MNPDQFYRKDDSLSPTAHKRLWAIIASRRRIPSTFWSIPDGRSFFYGMAASLVILLSTAGLVSILGQTLHARQPAEIQFDDAYRSAIAEFEDLLPAVSSSARAASSHEALRAKLQQLVLIDAAIKDLRSDLASIDLSPLKQSKLRSLYSMKLQVLQEIIEQGDTRS